MDRNLRIREEGRDSRLGEDGQEKITWIRQQQIFDPSNFSTPVTIVGLGNIGSQTAIALGRLGLNDFILYDHDEIEPHNLSSQSFFNRQLGTPKVLATRDIILGVNENASVLPLESKFTGTKNIEGVLIIAVDSMKERKKIASNLKKGKVKPSLIIDGRMGGPQLEVYTCDSVTEWESTLVDQASSDPCGARYICYTSMVIGAFIANQVKRHLNNEKIKKNILFNIDSLSIL